MRTIQFALASTLLAGGCTTESIAQVYGQGQPGLGLPEGGEIRHENVRAFGSPAQSWLMVYQYTAASDVPTAPFPKPDGTWGNCVDERQDQTWPFKPITGATYLNLPKVVVNGPGMPTGGLDVIETNPPNQTGNSTFRHYDFTYGGGAPGAGFNGSLTADESTPGGDYTLDIGKPGCGGFDKNGVCNAASADIQPMRYHMPEAYTTPLGIGMIDQVFIPRDQDLVLTWDAPPNHDGSGEQDYRKYFNFTFFVDPNNPTNPPQFICFPDKPGHTVVPKSVIEQLTENGLIVHADMTHFQDARETTAGEMRRFDLVGIYCNISNYTKQ